MLKKYNVVLSGDELEICSDILDRGRHSAEKRKRAHALILLNDGDTDAEVAGVVSMSIRGVQEIRKRIVEDGFETVLEGKSRGHRPCILTDDNVARLVQLACERTEDGIRRWTLRGLEGKMFELHGITASYETIRRTLKKQSVKPWQSKEWCIPPNESAAFVANMEDILDINSRPEDPEVPYVYMDESPIQLIGEVRTPFPTKPGAPMKYDTEYERRGNASIFMFAAPKIGFRRVSVLERRTKIDFANEIDTMCNKDFPDAEKIILVCDNLNTHKPSSLYEAFPPEKARWLAKRIEFHYTPVHGSWLNMAEIEFSDLINHGLKPRISSIEELNAQSKAWEKRRNKERRKINWTFTTEKAREKMKKTYPQIQQ
jgi:hypothetical protein